MPILPIYYVALALAALASIAALYYVRRFGNEAAGTTAGILPGLLYMYLLGLDFHPDVPAVWGVVLLGMIVVYWTLYFILSKRHAKKQARESNHTT